MKKITLNQQVNKHWAKLSFAKQFKLLEIEIATYFNLLNIANRFYCIDVTNLAKRNALRQIMFKRIQKYYGEETLSQIKLLFKID